MLAWFDDMSTPLVGDLLKRWPELPNSRKPRPKRCSDSSMQHNCRSEERIQQRLEEIRQAVPATTDAALLGRQSVIQPRFSCWRVCGRPSRSSISQIEAVYPTHPDRFHHRIVTGSRTGAGAAVACGLGNRPRSFPHPPPTWRVVLASPR